jgi:uncharacterized SAM-binding protein YcdF (DUF218 family)
MLGSLARLIGFLTMAAATVGAVLLAGAFVWFVFSVPNEGTILGPKADGIVVLTGAASRIPDAIELLAADRGQRLLITGVHRATSKREIARLTPLYSRFFSCCVDLDRSALNTFGNAIETKRWAKEHNFNTLIVVTSNWHMPRAMVELQHQLPEVTLIPYPVVSEKIKTESWLHNGEIVRILLSEYLKYLFAILRLHLDPDTAA